MIMEESNTWRKSKSNKMNEKTIKDKERQIKKNFMVDKMNKFKILCNQVQSIHWDPKK